MVQNNKDSLLAQVGHMADLVVYQTNSVVSRTLIDKEAGTVTLFAFSAGQGLSEHTAPFDAMVYVIDGETDITISGKTLRLKSGDTIIMPAGETHALRAVSAFKMLLVMIKS
jgi:quercetin dioxygenase-like cupin family protein